MLKIALGRCIAPTGLYNNMEGKQIGCESTAFATLLYPNFKPPNTGKLYNMYCLIIILSEYIVQFPPIEVSQSRDILTSHTFVTPYWRSSHSLPGMLWYGVDIL